MREGIVISARRVEHRLRRHSSQGAARPVDADEGAAESNEPPWQRPPGYEVVAELSRLGGSSRRREARGQVVVLVIVALLGLLGMCAMVIDLGPARRAA
jgi:hypothetical protein